MVLMCVILIYIKRFVYHMEVEDQEWAQYVCKYKCFLRDGGFSADFSSNIKRIEANQLTSVPPEVIGKP